MIIPNIWKKNPKNPISVPNHQSVIYIWLVVLTILKNMQVSWDDYHIIWKNKTCSKPPTSLYYNPISFPIVSYSIYLYTQLASYASIHLRFVRPSINLALFFVGIFQNSMILEMIFEGWLFSLWWTSGSCSVSSHFIETDNQWCFAGMSWCWEISSLSSFFSSLSSSPIILSSYHIIFP